MRNDLIRDFGTAAGRAQVGARNFLDVEAHGRAIITSLFQNNISGQSPVCNLQDYCIVALYTDLDNNVGHGVVVGDLHAPGKLVVLNTADVHFDPCLLL